MSLLVQSGLAALGLAALGVAVPAQTYYQGQTTRVETIRTTEGRVRTPFFRFFQSSPKTTPTTQQMFTQTTEPPLAAGDSYPGPTVPPQEVPTPPPSSPYSPVSIVSDPNAGFQPMPMRSPMPVVQAPAPIPTATPAPNPTPALSGNVPTHTDFASSFQPQPGDYQASMLHPYTRQPVTVNFKLPPTRGAYKTRATTRYVEFDSPDHSVEIRFTRDGQVKVDVD